MRTLGVFVATCGYIGYSPVAPGTVGSLVGLVLSECTRRLGGGFVEVWLLVLIVGIGVWSSSLSERYFQTTDPGTIVIDEVAGMLLTLLLLQVTWVGALVGFFAFRVFDIIKPFPARRAERLQGGWGVMTDDLVAGFYAHMTVRLVMWISPIPMVL